MRRKWLGVVTLIGNLFVPLKHDNMTLIISQDYNDFILQGYCSFYISLWDNTLGVSKTFIKHAIKEGYFDSLRFSCKSVKKQSIQFLRSQQQVIRNFLPTSMLSR